MGTSQQQVVVTDQNQYQSLVQQYLAAGYIPQQMSDNLAILVKTAERKKLGCMFVFFLFVFFPIAILMLISSNKEPDSQMVMIRLEAATVVQASAITEVPLQDLQMSEDRQHWWDGANWIHTDASSPPMAKRSSDDQLWWDGESWRAVR